MGLRALRILMFFFVLGLVSGRVFAQQVVQRGPLGTPAQVLDDTGQWTTPLQVSSDHDVEIYVPDVSTADWLKRNYEDFEGKDQYVLSFFTFYRNPKACRANQVAWGHSDAEHLDACDDISYRVRQVTVDAHLKTVTLIMAAMVDQDGQIVPPSVERQAISRNWRELDPHTQEALEKATGFVSEQMRIYNRKVNGVR